MRKNARELFLAADKYALEELKIMCVKYLCENLSVNNVLEYVNFADTYGVDKLKEQALDFIISHAEDIVNIAGIKMKDLPEDTIGEVIRRLASIGKHFQKCK